MSCSAGSAIGEAAVNPLELPGGVGQYQPRWCAGQRQMGGAVDDIGARRPRSGNLGKLAGLVAKTAVTVACFWLISRKIELSRVLAAAPSLDWGWVTLALATLMLQIPLVAARWRRVLAVLVQLPERATRLALMAVTAIGIFFLQVLPSVAGDGIRIWFAHRLGCDWRSAVSGVAIDRGIGLGLLLTLGFVILLVQADPIGLDGLREHALGLFGTLLSIGILILALGHRLEGWLSSRRALRWIGYLLVDAQRVMLGRNAPVIVVIGLLVHSLTIIAVLSLGRALGLMLSTADAAILFTVMVGVTSVPISISGWGLRELAVVSLLGRHGVPAEEALLFSVGFGVTLAVASLPGALVWLLYSSAPDTLATLGRRA